MSLFISIVLMMLGLILILITLKHTLVKKEDYLIAIDKMIKYIISFLKVYIPLYLVLYSGIYTVLKIMGT